MFYVRDRDKKFFTYEEYNAEYYGDTSLGIDAKRALAIALQNTDYTEDELLDMVEPQDLYRYGFIPEFIGRIPIITRTSDLSVEAMVRILTEPKNAIVKQYQDLFAYDGVELWFDDDALEAVAEIALKRKTGARGLRSICEKVLQQAMFDLPSMTGVTKVIVHKDCVTDGVDPEYVYGKSEGEASDGDGEAEGAQEEPVAPGETS